MNESLNAELHFDVNLILYLIGFSVKESSSVEETTRRHRRWWWRRRRRCGNITEAKSEDNLVEIRELNKISYLSVDTGAGGGATDGGPAFCIVGAA